MAERRLKSHKKFPTGKRVATGRQRFRKKSMPGKRGVITRQRAERFLADADIYQDKMPKKEQ